MSIINLSDYPVLLAYAVVAQSSLSSANITTVNDGYYGCLNYTVTGTYIPTGTPSGLNSSNVSTANTQVTALVGSISVITPTSPLLTSYSGATLNFSPNILYKTTSLTINSGSILNFDAAGDSTAQFFIQTSTGSITLSSLTINLLNGAQSCNIFWVANTSMSFSNVTNLFGLFMAGSSITSSTATNVFGHLYARGTGLSLTGTTLVDSKCTVVCYRKGTKILTETGYRCIEDLAVGEKVATTGTIEDNSRLGMDFSNKTKLYPIIWTGYFTVKVQNSSSLPICIRADALGDNVPNEDLYVSPAHRIFVGTTMRLARDLVNDTTIFQVPYQLYQEPIVYYHIELPHHLVILAQNVPSESFNDPTTFRQLFDSEAKKLNR